METERFGSSHNYNHSELSCAGTTMSSWPRMQCSCDQFRSQRVSEEDSGDGRCVVAWRSHNGKVTHLIPEEAETRLPLE